METFKSLLKDGKTIEKNTKKRITVKETTAFGTNGLEFFDAKGKMFARVLQDDTEFVFYKFDGHLMIGQVRMSESILNFMGGSFLCSFLGVQ